jgi:hypothetical protein
MFGSSADAVETPEQARLRRIKEARRRSQSAMRKILPV